MRAAEIVAEVEHQGGYLELHGDRIRYRLLGVKAAGLLAELRAHREEVVEVLQERIAAYVSAAKSIPSRAVLLAPRYDGVGRPLAAVPECWCCATPWRLERAERWQGKSYAFLEPGCGCLDAPQALNCCGLCVNHCACNGSAAARRL